MMLPNRENAYIPPAKLKDYLLSETHIDARSKARFFHAFGYDEVNVKLLERGLLLIARKQEVQEEVEEHPRFVTAVPN